MNLIKVNNYEELSQKASEIIIKKIQDNPSFNLGLATGSTPEGMYRKLVEDHQNGGTSYKNVKTFNLDEYVGIPEDDPNSYHYFMNQHLLGHIDIEKSNTHIPNGNQMSDLQRECEEYEKLIDQSGGIDLQVLGLGVNGHVGFNEPGTPFESPTHIVELTQDTREANARFFNSLEEVPTHAVTMGISTIMKSKEIILLVSGAQKAHALSRLLNGEITEECPVTVLGKHPNVTIIADRAALGEE
ncbi:glucosamine-6-phosphate deaminase [Niallia sp. XMNu-256]|uniref:glucosamine-6-phosphate deaminase n=1 Tax=Niallia sp. XMNu-256 TaxID=3082444 RepID=UPI0030D2AF8A